MAKKDERGRAHGADARRRGWKRQSRHPENPLPKQKQEPPGLESELTPRPAYTAPAYRAAGKLEGMAALITGGDSGIGRAVAVLYAREGADVAIIYLPEEQSDAEETRDAVEAEDRRCLLLPGDITDPAFCEQAVEQTVAEFGRLDVLVNNAATQRSVKSLEEIDVDEWEHTFRTNVHSQFYLAKAALPHLRPGSSIIASGSVAGLRGSGRLLDYSATKGAIHSFTKALAQNLVDRGIRVNCVAPGPVWTPLNPADPGMTPEDVSKFGEKQPMQRPAQPEETAPLYVFLASPADSSYLTGEVIAISGGEVMAA